MNDSSFYHRNKFQALPLHGFQQQYRIFQHDFPYSQFNWLIDSKASITKIEIIVHQIYIYIYILAGKKIENEKPVEFDDSINDVQIKFFATFFYDDDDDRVFIKSSKHWKWQWNEKKKSVFRSAKKKTNRRSTTTTTTINEQSWIWDYPAKLCIIIIYNNHDHHHKNYHPLLPSYHIGRCIPTSVYKCTKKKKNVQ